MGKNFFTKSVHAGNSLLDNHGAISMPVYHSSVYAFPDAEKGAAIHEGEIPGFFYGRISNPTQEVLETAMAELESGEAALALSSGMAAISNCLLTLLQQGDHIVVPESIYASTGSLLNYLSHSFGIAVTFINGTEPAAYESAISSNTKVLYLESPSNPTLKLCDIAAIVKIAKKYRLTTVIDNTFATPYNQNPLKMGVDVVIHSMTKYIGGHADIVAGILVGSNEFVKQCRWKTNKLLGGVIAPQTAWLAHRGLKTLALRMERHNENAIAVARFLEKHPKVLTVHYPGLKSHPQHKLANQQMKGFGGMVSFELEGAEAGRKLVNNLNLCTLAVSLGDVSTLIQHSASMTHASVSQADREKAGISDGLLRLSVGIEDKADIITDLKKGLKKV